MAQRFCTGHQRANFAITDGLGNWRGGQRQFTRERRPCYGANLQRQIRRYGYFIDKILKGTRAGDIPIEQPTTYELIVNARTAKLLGLSIPNSILISAEVIE